MLQTVAQRLPINACYVVKAHLVSSHRVAYQHEGARASQCMKGAGAARASVRAHKVTAACARCPRVRFAIARAAGAGAPARPEDACGGCGARCARARLVNPTSALAPAQRARAHGRACARARSRELARPKVLVCARAPVFECAQTKTYATPLQELFDFLQPGHLGPLDVPQRWGN